MRLPAALLLLLIGCRTEPPQQPAPPRIVQLPSKTPIKPSTTQPPASAERSEPASDPAPERDPAPEESAPAQDTIDPSLRQMMTPAGVVAPHADAGADGIVDLPPVPDAQIPPLDAHAALPESP